MLGWWHLLLMYGIAINLGIDESIFTAVVVNGASDVNGPNSLGVNGSNASDNGSGSTASDEKRSKDVNGPNALGVNSTTGLTATGSNALGVNKSKASNVNGSIASNVNGSTASNVNGSTASNVNGSTASNVNGSTASNMNKAIVEKKNIVIRRRRQKRDGADPFGLSKAFPALFATALAKAVAMKSGKRVVNTEADRYLGVDLSGYKFFAGDPSDNCTSRCPCGSFDCVPIYKARGDACCATDYSIRCCPEPTYSRGNPTKLDSVGQKLCLKAPISCRIDSTEACDFEQQAYILVKQQTSISLERVLGLLDEKCEASHFRMAFYGQINKYGDKPRIVRPTFFLENKEGCPMCGWELCVIMTKQLGCSCCAYESLAYCRWQMSRSCIYVPDDAFAEDSPKCPDCQWKMSFSDDRTAFKCCDQSTLHQCTKVDVLPDDPLSKSTLVNVNDACKRLVHDQCHCGWGSCFPREGRAASKCCNEHYALVCCEEVEVGGADRRRREHFEKVNTFLGQPAAGGVAQIERNQHKGRNFKSLFNASRNAFGCERHFGGDGD